MFVEFSLEGRDRGIEFDASEERVPERSRHGTKELGRGGSGKRHHVKIWG